MEKGVNTTSVQERRSQENDTNHFDAEKTLQLLERKVTALKKNREIIPKKFLITKYRDDYIKILSDILHMETELVLYYLIKPYSFPSDQIASMEALMQPIYDRTIRRGKTALLHDMDVMAFLRILELGRKEIQTLICNYQGSYRIDLQDFDIQQLKIRGGENE